MFVIVVLILQCLCQLSHQFTNEELIERIIALEKTVEEQQTINAAQEKTITSLLQENRGPCQCQTVDHQPNKRFILEEGPVAFTAAIKPFTYPHARQNNTVVFESTVTAIGSGYSNLTGVFVAPLPGIYLFSCSMLDHTGEHNDPTGSNVGAANLHAEIVQNGRILGRIFAHAESNHRDQGAITVITHANQGDQIWVRTIDNDDVGIGGEMYSVFSGYLVSEMYE